MSNKIIVVYQNSVNLKRCITWSLRKKLIDSTHQLIFIKYQNLHFDFMNKYLVYVHKTILKQKKYEFINESYTLSKMIKKCIVDYYSQSKVESKTEIIEPYVEFDLSTYSPLVFISCYKDDFSYIIQSYNPEYVILNKQLYEKFDFTIGTIIYPG